VPFREVAIACITSDCTKMHLTRDRIRIARRSLQRCGGGRRAQRRACSCYPPAPGGGDVGGPGLLA
jgi:hypothetical protein